MKDQTISALQAKHMLQCWASQRDYKPIEVVSTDGCWIYTADGRKIFDLRSAHESINLGFRHPSVVQAMKEQMESVIYVTDDFATSPTAKLAQRLAEITPGDPEKKVYFSQSGATAIEAAVRGARLYKYNQVLGDDGYIPDAPRQYPFPYKIICRYRSWHGSTASAISASGDPRRWFAEPATAPGFIFGPDAGGPSSPFKAEDVDQNIEYLDYLIEQEGGNGKVAAFLVEPIVGSNGVRLPPPDYLEKLQGLCRKWDLLLIVDETMTGMGRTGRMFACEHYGIEPDILVMGKALGAYCPLAATVFSNRVAASFDDNIFGIGQSFSGHALGCAAALAAIEVLQTDGFLQHVREQGEWLNGRLRELLTRYPIISEIQGVGLFYTIHLASSQSGKPIRKATEKYEESLVSKIAQYLLEEHGIYTPSDKFGIWVVPPLVVTREELEWIVESIDDALTQFT